MKGKTEADECGQVKEGWTRHQNLPRTTGFPSHREEGNTYIQMSVSAFLPTGL